jgi:hypothetical protein
MWCPIIAECGILDEADFVGGANVDLAKSKIMNTYRSVKRRMQSRFIRNGTLATKLFIVSSKKSDQDFVEKYLETVKGDSSVLVVDEPQWKVKPPGTYSGKMFQVAVGSKTIRSRVVLPEDDIPSLVNQGYRILDVPVEFKKDFERDVDSSLMEFAGISSTLVSKFIAYERLKDTYCDDSNPFSNSIISVGTNDDLTVQDFFRPELVSPLVASKPIYIHIDGSLTGDRTGISGVAVMGLRESTRYVDGEVVPVNELLYRHVFSVGIQCPTGAEISLQKNREFIYYLKYTLNYNIAGVSLDGFQSADGIQQLKQAGFDAKLLSLDRTPDGYMYLKASLNEKRISMLHIDPLEKELVNLERNNMTGKVDHPVSGSKDIADSLCGALYNASSYDDMFMLHLADDYVVMSGSNDIEEDPQKKMEKNMSQIISNNPERETTEDTIAGLGSIVGSVVKQQELEQRAAMEAKINKMRSTLSPLENRQFSNSDLEDAMLNQSDDMLIF